MSYRASLESGEPRPGRRNGPLALVVVALVMAASAAGVWAAWRIISHHGGGAVPLIHADESPVKVPPANPGGMNVPDQNISILNDKRPHDPRIEQLLPQPEAPLPRPVPAEPTLTEAAPGPAPAPVAASAANALSAAAPLAAPVAAPAASVAPVPPPAAIPAALPPRLVATEAGYRLQIGAVRSTEAAQQEWARLKRMHADILGKLDMRTSRIDLAARGVFYRIEAGPIGNGAAAQRACDQLKQRKVGCILVRP